VAHPYIRLCEEAACGVTGKHLHYRDERLPVELPPMESRSAASAQLIVLANLGVMSYLDLATHESSVAYQALPDFYSPPLCTYDKEVVAQIAHLLWEQLRTEMLSYLFATPSYFSASTRDGQEHGGIATDRFCRALWIGSQHEAARLLPSMKQCYSQDDEHEKKKWEKIVAKVYRSKLPRLGPKRPLQPFTAAFIRYREGRDRSHAIRVCGPNEATIHFSKEGALRMIATWPLNNATIGTRVAHLRYQIHKDKLVEPFRLRDVQERELEFGYGGWAELYDGQLTRIAIFMPSGQQCLMASYEELSMSVADSIGITEPAETPEAMHVEIMQAQLTALPPEEEVEEAAKVERELAEEARTGDPTPTELVPPRQALN